MSLQSFLSTLYMVFESHVAPQWQAAKLLILCSLSLLFLVALHLTPQ